MGESIITRRVGAGINISEYELLADIEVTSATTSVELSGFEIFENDELLLVSDIYNSTASGSAYYLYINNNTTSTNYYRQYLYADNTTVGASRGNNTEYIANSANSYGLCSTKIKLTNNGYCATQNDASRYLGTASTLLTANYNTTTFTVPSINTITVIASVSSSIGVGSRFQLYKLQGGA